ncbi:MAG: hypothetical protein Q7S23_00945 [bacterium]|nr:hypothetical protein [bacterium]
MPKAKPKSWAGSFIFWMTAVGIGMATFFALLGVTTFILGTTSTRILTTWYWPAPSPAPLNPEPIPVAAPGNNF